MLTTTYFSALHDEALTLLVEARNYIVTLRLQGNGDTQKNIDYLDVTLETTRLTSRLTQVMAWILAQKAVQNDEITAEEAASEKYKLSGQSVCLEHTSPESAANLPAYLIDLLHRSHDLYARVNRLEAQITNRLAVDETETSRSQGEAPRLRVVSSSGQSPQNAY